MPTFITKQEARDAADRKIRVLKKATADIALEEAVASVQDSEDFDIFLSHSISDAKIVMGVKTILESEGYRVYVDWINDKTLDRFKVTPETAEVLRNRMRKSKSLIYIATDNASSSKWMPWELGFFDGHKPGQVAIFPVLDSPESRFKGQEYLGLYPVVDRDKYKDTPASEPLFFVEGAHPRQWTELSQFAKGKSEWSNY